MTGIGEEKDRGEVFLHGASKTLSSCGSTRYPSMIFIISMSNWWSVLKSAEQVYMKTRKTEIKITKSG